MKKDKKEVKKAGREPKEPKEKDRTSLYIHEQDKLQALADKDGDLLDDEKKNKVMEKALAIQEKAYKEKNEVISATDALKQAKRQHKATAHPLEGKKAGRYKIDGKVIKWDGTKEIE